MDNLDKDEFENLVWYHPTLTRHTAESILMQNGNDGTYLLRPSLKSNGNYALSVKCDQAVKHFPILWTSSEIKFGQCTFKSIQEFVDHFKNKPLLSGHSGQVVLLRIPYPREVEEPDTYESIVLHGELCSAEESHHGNISFSVNSKVGFLTKVGGYVKSWRKRWFVLRGNELKYFKQKGSKTYIRVLDLNECKECCQDFTHTHKNYVFRLDMGWRVFYLSCTSAQDMHDWIKNINFQLKGNSA